jgi:hypothetical protein
MKKITAATLCLFISIATWAQSKTEVETAVRDYVDGFYYGDTAKLYNALSTDLVKNGYYRRKDKTEYTLDSMSFRECITYAQNVKKRGVSANVESFPKKIEVLDVLDKTAAAKLTAWWGTDYLLLSRIDNKWKITHVLWQSPPPAK